MIALIRRWLKPKTCTATYDGRRCDRANTPEAHDDGMHDAFGRNGVAWAVREDEPNYLPLNRQRRC